MLLKKIQHTEYATLAVGTTQWVSIYSTILYIPQYWLSSYPVLQVLCTLNPR